MVSHDGRIGSLRRALLVALALAAAPALAQPLSLEFADEAAQDASWAGFRKRLLAAIEKRDRQFVLSILDRNVRAGIEGARGILEFRRRWSLDAADSPLWRELAAALALGSAWLERERGPRELCAPYLLARWPQAVDPLKHGALVAREVLVKAEPSHQASTLATLSHAIVPVTDWEVDDRARDSPQKWVRIRVKEADGFVPEEQIRSPVEHTACFVRTERGWRMTAFAPAGG
jgi:hypothetical protein